MFAVGKPLQEVKDFRNIGSLNLLNVESLLNWTITI
jgi:hypothetical protein